MKKSALFAALAGAALSATAFAQCPGAPTVVEDFGTLVAGSPITRTWAVVAGQVNWYKFTLAAPVRYDNLTFLDIDTSGTGFDTEIGLYNCAGNLVNTDDDDGPGTMSAQSFGTGSGQYPGGAIQTTNTISNSRDGDLPAGDYYVAVGGYNMTFNATAFGVTTTSTLTGTMVMTLNYGATPAVTSPANTIDLGTMAASDARTNAAASLSAGNTVQWYKVTIPEANNALGTYFDCDTEGTVLAPSNTTRIAFYTVAGAFGQNATTTLTDTVDGSNSLSQMTFGSTTPARPAVGNGLTYNGRDGILRGGTWYMAVAGTGTAPSTSADSGRNFGMTSTSTNYGPVTVHMYTGAPTTNPAGTGSSAPTSVPAGGTSLLSVLVTPGANPTSTGLAVKADLSSLGGSSAQDFYDDGTNGDVTPGDNRFSYSFTTSGSAVIGSYTLPFTISDAQARSGSGNITLGIVAPPPANDNCTTAFVVNEGTFTFDNSAATTDGLTVCSTSGKDLWWEYIPTFTGTSQVSTCTLMTSDTVLAAFSSCGGTQLACNDDFCSLQSQISFSVTTGVPVWIRVANYGSAPTGGAGAFTISAPPPTNPAGTGAASCITENTPGTAQLNVTVTPGTNPTSTGIAVSVDASAIGGSATETLFDDGAHNDGAAGDNNFGGSVAYGALGAGSYTLPFTITDAESRSGSGSITAAALSNDFTGELPASAQIPSGSGDITQLSGTMGANKVEMWQIEICDPTLFSANTFGSTVSDTQIFLFDANGVGVAYDDDDPAGTHGLQSAITNAHVSAPGIYYIAASQYNRDPYGGTPCANALLWNNTPFNTERAPDGPGATLAVGGWTGATTGGAYVINLTGAVVPGSCGGGGCTVSCDYNDDGGADFSDVIDLANDIAAGTTTFPQHCKDFNQDGGEDTGDVIDIADAIASGTCP